MGTSYFPDLKQLRLAAKVVPQSSSQVRVRGRRASGRFLRGPTPWAWLNRAAQLPGRALHVAVAIRLWVGIKKTDCIKLPTSTLTEMGVTRHATRRAVQALENAGLLAVTRHVGRKTRVRVVEVDEAGGQEASSR